MARLLIANNGMPPQVRSGQSFTLYRFAGPHPGIV